MTDPRPTPTTSDPAQANTPPPRFPAEIPEPANNGGPVPETDDRTMSLKIFRGAARAQGYAENPTTGELPVFPASMPPGGGPGMPPGPPREQVQPGGRVTTHGVGTAPAPWGAPPAPVTVNLIPARADWGWRGVVTRTKVVKLAPSKAELAHLQAIATISAATWTRSVNAVVTNPKGGVGKTPTTLIVAGILAALRGGSVAALEAAEAAGTLTARSEGAPQRGLGELVDAIGGIHTAGNLSGYGSPQKSYAHVFGTVGTRRPLGGDDVLNVRRVLDTYYRITVTDTGGSVSVTWPRCDGAIWPHPGSGSRY